VNTFADWIFKNWKPVSRIMSFFVGVAIAVHEVFLSEQAQPQNLGFAALLMGWVVAWRADEIRAATRTKRGENGGG
jgi:hypothetical protein